MDPMEVWTMKILVTGGAGFIGSHVVNRYLDLGHDVVVVDDLSTGRISNLDPRATFYQIDIRDPGIRDVFEREQPEIINHHAAQMNVRRSVADPLFDVSVNIVGSLNLIECAKQFGVRRFIYISTGGAVYGEPIYLPCDENHPINPICQYGASKHTVEHYLYMYHENYGLESIVLRYPNVYGPRQDPNGEAGVIAIFTGKMLAGESVTINGDGEQTRDYVYVGDCAAANVLALDTGITHGIFNLGSEVGTSVNEIFEHLARLTDYQGAAFNGPPKIGETRHIYLNAGKARELLGWQPAVKLAGGLRETVSYFREGEQLTPVAVQRVREAVPKHAGKPAETTTEMGDFRIRTQESMDDGLPQKADGVRDIPSRIRLIEQSLTGKSLNTIPLVDILKTTLESTGGKGGSILLMDDDGNLTKAVLAFESDIKESDPHTLQITLEKSLAGWVRTHRNPALVTDTSLDPRWYQTDWETSASVTRSAMSVPLMESESVRGVLTLTHPKKDEFTKEDLALLLTAATLLTIDSDTTFST